MKDHFYRSALGVGDRFFLSPPQSIFLSLCPILDLEIEFQTFKTLFFLQFQPIFTTYLHPDQNNNPTINFEMPL